MGVSQNRRTNDGIVFMGPMGRFGPDHVHDDCGPLVSLDPQLARIFLPSPVDGRFVTRDHAGTSVQSDRRRALGFVRFVARIDGKGIRISNVGMAFLCAYLDEFVGAIADSRGITGLVSSPIGGAGTLHVGARAGYGTTRDDFGRLEFVGLLSTLVVAVAGQPDREEESYGRRGGETKEGR